MKYKGMLTWMLAVLAGSVSSSVTAELSRENAIQHGSTTNAYVLGEIVDGQRIDIESASSSAIATRFIVTLDTPSIIAYKSQLTRANSLDTVSSLMTNANKITTHVSLIEQIQARVETQIKQLAPQVKIVGRYKNTMNALVVDINTKDAAKLNKIQYVTKVTEDHIYKANLEQSVSIIGAPTVWQLTSNENNAIQGHGISVAILDSGIDYTHPALGGCFGSGCKVVAGYDFINNDADPMDDNGHGTHVAGIVGANSSNVKGVAPEVTLHAYKVLNQFGNGPTSSIIAAIEKAVDPDGDPTTDDAVDIINMSLGGTGAVDSPVNDAVNGAVQAGVVVIVAAGNDGEYGDINTHSPANAEHAITVASSTKQDTLSSFSSKALPGTLTKPEITAPGSGIASTLPSNEVGTANGTSMAAPHVAGAAALLLQHDPSLTPAKVRHKLLAGAEDINENPYAQGAGRLNVSNSVNARLISDQAMIHFGTVDKTASSYLQTQRVSFTNVYDQELTFQLDFDETMPHGITLSLEQNSITLAPNETKSVDIELRIENVADLVFANNEAGVHFGKLTASSDEYAHLLSVNLTLEHVIKAQLDTNSPREVRVFIDSDDGTFSSSTALRLGNPANINVPAKPATMTVFYLGLNEFFVSGGLPQGSTVIGVETFSLDANSDFTQTLDFRDLQQLVGINEISDQQGNALPLSTINGEMVDYTVAHPQKSYYINLEGVHYRYGLKPYLAVGHLTAQSELRATKLYSTNSRLSNSDEHHLIALIDSFDNDTLNQGEKQLDLSNVNSVTTEFDLSRSFNQYRVSIDSQGAKITHNVDANPSKLTTHYVTQTDNSHKSYTKVAQINTSSQSDFGNYIAASAPFMPIGQSDLNLYIEGSSSSEVGRASSRKIDFKSEAMFWSGEINIDNGYLSLIAPNDATGPFSVLSDTRGNKHDQGVAKSVEFLCEQASNTTELNQIDQKVTRLLIPALNCNDSMQIRMSFESSLFGENYVSSLQISNLDNSYIPSISSLNLYQGDNLVLDHIINKINAKLRLSSVSDEFTLESLAVRYNGSDWQSLPFSQLTNTHYEAALAMLSGQQIADIRLVYLSSTGAQVIQTLNGLFRLGLEAGSDSDVDNDGIDNANDTDNDNDGYLDEVDAFPYNANEWLDTDLDGVGNNADLDDDNDGHTDDNDAFPLDSSEWLDTDLDGIGNNADTDDDNDGHNDESDAFPLDSSEWLDTDLDGIGNNADTDDDNDGYPDDNDAFPLDSSEWLDTDLDGIGNNADPDDDNDGYNDANDAFPLNSSEWLDTDLDGLGNNADPDDDNDGYTDENDAFPLNSSEWLDTDLDGIGNNADLDDDNDGYNDTNDAFPLDNSEWLDTDLDGLGNNADPDDDNDGYNDANDAFPLNSSEWFDTDLDGIGNNADTDDDNDGHNDESDAFPLNSSEWLDTDLDGIGNNADPDDDNDGYNDGDDAFPLDSSEWLDTDLDGVGNNEDLDDDNDGHTDESDAFPLDSSEWLDTDLDGIGNNADPDDDNDGVNDASDAFPLDATRSSEPTNSPSANGGSGGSLHWLLLMLSVLIVVRSKNRIG